VLCKPAVLVIILLNVSILKFLYLCYASFIDTLASRLNIPLLISKSCPCVSKMMISESYATTKGRIRKNISREQPSYCTGASPSPQTLLQAWIALSSIHAHSSRLLNQEKRIFISAHAVAMCSVQNCCNMGTILAEMLGILQVGALFMFNKLDKCPTLIQESTRRMYVSM